MNKWIRPPPSSSFRSFLKVCVTRDTQKYISNTQNKVCSIQTEWNRKKAMHANGGRTSQCRGSWRWYPQEPEPGIMFLKKKKQQNVIIVYWLHFRGSRICFQHSFHLSLAVYIAVSWFLPARHVTTCLRLHLTELRRALYFVDRFMWSTYRLQSSLWATA